MSVRIAQISDLHSGREVPRIAEALLDDLRDARPTMVAVCGDLTQGARSREFLAAREFLDQLPAPALVVPGNHDLPGWRIWSRFLRPWLAWTRHIATTDTTTATPLSVDGVVAVGVNTARQWSMHLDWSRGRINASQIAAVENVLRDTAPDTLRVVVAHHPFLLTMAGQRRGPLGRSTYALQRLRSCADLLLGGHVHLAYSGVVAGLVVAQSGTAFSDRLKGEPNGYNLIDGDRTQVTVTTRQWTGSRFDDATRSRFVRGDDGWRAAS